MKLLEISDNYIWDDQITPTCSNGIRFDTTSLKVFVDKLILRNNQIGVGVTTRLSGLSATSGPGGSVSYWLVNDGLVQQWAGYGSPEGLVAASVGSTFVNLNGSTTSTLFVKTSGTGNTGWTAK